MKKALMIYGQPGAGKGAQANLMAWNKGWIHFDTGKYLEQVLHDPSLQKDERIKQERENFDAGILVDPPFVLDVVSKKAKEISEAGFNVVFSGSPRTMYEAFGKDPENKYPPHEGILDILEKSYGKENVLVVLLDVSPETSIYRNSRRKVCSVCGNAILYKDATHHHENCPLCDGKLRTRVLDTPDTIKVRLKEYRERTKPILDGLKKRGYKVVKIDGERPPYKVFEDLQNKLGL